MSYLPRFAGLDGAPCIITNAGCWQVTELDLSLHSVYLNC
ncbi:MAG: hypothetical protein JWO41_511 [Candidatus Saccharibacteria bacterium]|nr:hypothetical protein [Candidatus Saccharibacteria bacterium]